MSSTGSRCAERRSSADRYDECTPTRALTWILAWTCTCHWSGTVTVRAEISSNSACGDAADASTSRYEPWSGNPSRHSAAQTISPPCLTTVAAADMPFTAW